MTKDLTEAITHRKTRMLPLIETINKCKWRILVGWISVLSIQKNYTKCSREKKKQRLRKKNEKGRLQWYTKNKLIHGIWRERERETKRELFQENIRLYNLKGGAQIIGTKMEFRSDIE